ncbi:uncharacterized protein LOC133183517 [Saccostrea echinata]|uniref:uncharacterized protein LOC133183517 n=1 Tax=Saccostrea echinata TaxID=191078 RepID=UPI002A8232BB|nr:uncharacterized protein LOC133183517 [Saccostrea echinata]
MDLPLFTKLLKQNWLFFLCTAGVMNFTDGNGEPCGTIDNGAQLYCPNKYHCCNTAVHSCCEDGYTCHGSTCISYIALIVIPGVISFVIIITVIAKLVKKRNVLYTSVGRPGLTTVEYSGNLPPYYYCQPESCSFLRYFYSVIKTGIINFKNKNILGKYRTRVLNKASWINTNR